MSLHRYRTLFLFLFAGLVGELSAQPFMYVSSRGNNSVKRYDATTGAYIDDFVPSGRGGKGRPQEVRFGPDGQIYVSFRDNDAIMKYDRETGALVGRFTSGYSLQDPTKMEFGPDGNLYVAQWGSTQRNMVMFDGTTGAFMGQVTSEPTSNLQMSPAWDANDMLYVAGFGSKDVRRYKPDGSLDRVFAGQPSLAGPVNLWFDTAGDLFVLDWELGRSLRFSSTGQPKGTFFSGLSKTEGFAVGPDGLLYVADWQLNRINRYNLATGAFVDNFVSSTNNGGLQNPNSILFSTSNTSTSAEDESILPLTITLEQNYPNPFQTSTSISYSLNRPGSVRITVFDLFGREIARPVDATQGAGSHEVTFSGNNLASGSYIYRIEADAERRTRLMSIVR